MEKPTFLLLVILLSTPNLGAISQPENYSRIGHMGHHLYYVISAPIEAKVGEEVKIIVEVWSTYDIVLTSFRLRVYGAGVNYEDRSETNANLPQGTGIPKAISITPTGEEAIYIEASAEYDWEIGGQHQQGYGDIKMPITLARAETFEELEEQYAQLSSRYYNYTELEGRYQELTQSLQVAESRIEDLTASYDDLRASYEQLLSEDQALQANYNDVLNQLEVQRAAANSYEYLAISSTAAAIIMLVAAILTRRRAGRAPGKTPSRKT